MLILGVRIDVKDVKVTVILILFLCVNCYCVSFERVGMFGRGRVVVVVVVVALILGFGGGGSGGCCAKHNSTLMHVLSAADFVQKFPQKGRKRAGWECFANLCPSL